MVASAGSATRTSPLQRLPAALFLLGTFALALSIPLPWTDVRVGPQSVLRPFYGYQESPASFLAIVIALMASRMLFVRWYAAGARVLAVAVALLALIGLGAADVDIQAQANTYREAAVFHVGFVLAAVAFMLFLAGTVVAFRLGDD